MATMSDMPEWWETVFNQHEISDLQRATDEAVNNNPDDQFDVAYLAGFMNMEFVDIEFSLPIEQVPSILKGLREAQLYTKVDADWQAFIDLFGSVLAAQYMVTDCEYDEEATDIATWFLPDDDDTA